MRKDIARMIREEAMFLHRAGWTYHPAVHDENGNIAMPWPDREPFYDLAERFRKAGVRINLSNLPSGWIDENEYDFRSMDDTLSGLVARVPDVLYIPRLRLDPPVKWMIRHPEEACVFEGASPAIEDVLKQLRSGKVSHTYDINAPRGHNYSVPMLVDQEVGLQSFTSKVWVKAACETLEKVVEHMSAQPYWEHIIGFHLCFGGTCELLKWSNSGRRAVDFSTKHTLAFFDWSLEKYGSIEALREAWDQPELTRETAFVPPSAWRNGSKPETLEAMYRRDGVGRFCEDYAWFHSETTVDAFLEIAKKFKELQPDLAVGVFYAYEGCGHDHIDRLLESPYVDYFSAPKSYAAPMPGGRGGITAPMPSIQRKKVWVDEFDNRTHLAYDPQSGHLPHINVQAAADLEESANVLWREVCKIEQFHGNWWWMDQGAPDRRWYNDDALMEVVADQVKLHQSMQENPAEDICEVYVVRDDNAVFYGDNGCGYASKWEALLSGVPFQHYRTIDLDEMDISRCRLLIFRNPMLLTKEKLAEYQSRMAPGGRVFLCDLPGVCATGLSMEYVREMTGMEVQQIPDENGNLVNIISGGAEEILIEDAFGVRCARCGSIYLGFRCDPAMLRGMAQASGVTPVISQNGVAHGNSRIIGVFSIIEDGLDTDVHLPRKGDWYEWFTKETYHDTDRVHVKIGPKKARVFIKK